MLGEHTREVLEGELGLGPAELAELARLMTEYLQAAGLTIGRAVRLLPAIALTQLLYPLAVIACCLARVVHWRGIDYRILGRGKVRMIEYVPFGASEQPADGNTSI